MSNICRRFRIFSAVTWIVRVELGVIYTGYPQHNLRTIIILNVVLNYMIAA